MAQGKNQDTYRENRRTFALIEIPSHLTTPTHLLAIVGLIAIIVHKIWLSINLYSASFPPANPQKRDASPPPL